jgi:hypothetical protein
MLILRLNNSLGLHWKVYLYNTFGMTKGDATSEGNQREKERERERYSDRKQAKANECQEFLNIPKWHVTIL